MCTGCLPPEITPALQTGSGEPAAERHVVPGEIDRGGWARVAGRLDRVSKTQVVAGQDDMVVGAR